MLACLRLIAINTGIAPRTAAKIESNVISNQTLMARKF